jgi:DNA polymerase Pol2
MISRRAKRFEGAFVFQPRPDLYQRIAVFDFRSLYPTIIISHNISPETYNCPCQEGKRINVPNSKDFFNNDKKGFLSKALGEIITKRIKIKEDIKDLKTKNSYGFKLLHAQEQTLKTIANSAYGYLGYERARWYCFGCARAVTAFGRHYIHNVIDTANKSGFTVLYSDTDSVFIQLNEKSIDEAKKFVDGINNGLPKGMELEYEGFYKSAIFVFSKAGSEGAKKRYALIDEEGNLTIKGFETIRRNWSNIGKKLQREVLRIILYENNIEKAMEFAMKVIKDVKERKVDLSDLVITTKLTKKISSYSSIGPHVTAAIKMREKGINVEPGTLIKYIISKPANPKGRQKISDNVMLFEDATVKDYDEEYYIEKQLIPAIESIFKTLGKEINLGKGRQSSLTSF